MTPTALLAPAPPVPAADDPQRLLPAHPVATWADHHARWGAVPADASGRLLEAAQRTALRGRSGGGFPTARKLAAVAAAGSRTRRPVVVVNACEGDPTSAKDAVLVGASPHLVVEGAMLTAAALRADRVLLAAHRGSGAAAVLRAVVGQAPSPVPVTVVELPARFVASEATAVVNALNTGDARPTGRRSRIWEFGVDGRPTMVGNAETFAQLALLGRGGADWFAALGDPAEPGTALVTVGGAVTRPGVLEVPTGTPLGTILGAAGAPPTGWVLTGGLAGRWNRVEDLTTVGFGFAAMAAAGAHRGVGSLTVLPADGCPLTETARVVGYLAAAGARQCGPCMFGLPAIAADLDALVLGDADALGRLRRRLPVIDGRGACAHPDGAVLLAGSVLAVLDRDPRAHLDAHLRGGPCGVVPTVPVGAA